ncbi:hypothetical protein C1646_767908 [Rhizophagus diaphanus]|nr:hypothetical protein C1646_767908 [Rhizophagus diaphanus] [Rhizophagus sp. MUCL 43196]
MINESNTISDDKHLAIVVKYMINNIPYMCYLGMLNLEETDTFYIFNGASTMIGHRSAGKDASLRVEYFKDYEKTLHKLYSYFSRSHKCQKILHIMQDINDEPMLELQNLIKTRWLFLSNVVGSLHKIMDSVLSSLNENSLAGKKTAENLILLLDKNFIIVTIFLADLTTVLKRLINVFQSDYVSLSHLKPHLKMAINSISEYFIRSTDMQLTYDRQMATYGQSEIDFLGKYYGDSKIVDGNIFMEIINKERLLEEWSSVKFYLATFSERDYNFVETWKHIFNTDKNFIDNYPTISLLV